MSTEALADILRAALFPKHACICGMYDGNRECHCDDELVADIVGALTTSGIGVIADAKAEALREAADDIEGRLHRGENPDLGYVSVAWLRNRAPMYLPTPPALLPVTNLGE